MLKYYNNRQLSDKLMINLAKWKRWSREFLPPDPLGGMQSGYARQYHPDQAFIVGLGGHLVAELKFSIPEVRQNLKDLHPWLKNNGFFFSAKGNRSQANDTPAVVKYYLIIIERLADTGFRYTVQGIISKKTAGYDNIPVVEARYTETIIKPGGQLVDTMGPVSAKLMNISRFLAGFVQSLNLDPVHYGAMGQVPLEPPESPGYGQPRYRDH